MNKRFITVAASFVIVGALALTGCASNEKPATDQTSAPPASSEAPPATSDAAPPTSEAAPEPPTTLSGTIAAGGASSQTAAQEAWRAGFQTANPDVTIDYDPSGSGTGRENFAAGGYIFAGTDSAFKVEEAAGPFAACAAGSGLVEIPAYISPIAVGFNLPGIDKLNLDADTMAKIFTGAITTWDDSAIAALNDGVELPDTAITAVHRSDKSGTTGNFTDYLAATAPETWTFGKTEEWPAELTGEAAEKTQGVRETITGAVGAVGYLDASQATDMGTAAIKVGEGFESYSPAAAAAAVGKSALEEGRAATDVVVKIDRNLTDAGVYPLILVSYLAACETYADAAQGAIVRAYFDYVISAEGQAAAAANAGSAPITGAEIEPKVAAAVAVIG